MLSEKSWVLLLAASITAIAGIVAATISVDAKRDRERLEAALAEKEAEIKRVEQHARNLESKRQASAGLPSQAVLDVDRATPSPPEDSQLASPVQVGGEAGGDATNDSPEAPQVEVEAPQIAIDTYRGAYFSFDLFGCQRGGDRVQCSLTVTNLTDESRGLNLCGEGDLVDDMGRKLRTKVRFSGGNSCGVLRLPPNLPRALEMSAGVHADSRRLNIVFGDTVAFRDVEIAQAQP